jgi:hypothetical protein
MSCPTRPPSKRSASRASTATAASKLAAVTVRSLTSQAETDTKTRVFGDLRFGSTCCVAGEYSAQRVSTHNPWLVDSSLTRPPPALYLHNATAGSKNSPAQRSKIHFLAVGTTVRGRALSDDPAVLFASPSSEPARAAWSLAALPATRFGALALLGLILVRRRRWTASVDRAGHGSGAAEVGAGLASIHRRIGRVDRRGQARIPL